uniref:Uncharacterized protein n=1 Tax=Janibacter limosus TaxID=53458 RepID=A0AC61U5H1_9MICO|nr:hypothetical protein [Janibacter limosus]
MTLARQVRRSLYVTLALVIVLVVVLAGVVFSPGAPPPSPDQRDARGQRTDR